MSNVFNLNKYRKKKARAESEKRAESNRRLHGRTKAERASDALQRRRLTAQVDGAKLSRSEPGPTPHDAAPCSMLFHITTQGAWETAQQQGQYVAPSLGDEGFIHLSEEHQWLATARRFFRGQTGLVLLCVDARLLEANVIYESADGDAFPHLYGALNLASVICVRELSVDERGELHLGPATES